MNKLTLICTLPLLLLVMLGGCDNDTTNSITDPGGGTAPKDKSCLGCHESEDMLKAALGIEKGSGAPTSGREVGPSAIRELEAWERVYMPEGSNRTGFLTSIHGPDYQGTDRPHVFTCQTCHGGRADGLFSTMEEAHTDLIADPSAFGASGCDACHIGDDARASACDGCHTGEVAATRNSLHTKLWGFKAAISDRCGFDFAGSAYEPYFDATCATCHATCGECHVSRPRSVDGGFPFVETYSAHRFRARPHVTEQCTACHSNTVGFDYFGEHAAADPAHEADVHLTELDYECMDCHTQAEIHGDASHADLRSRYDVANMPRCESTDCHPTLSANVNHNHHAGVATDCVTCHQARHQDVPGFNENCGACHSGGPRQFAYPLPRMQCQVCHSQPHQNCTNCHDLGTVRPPLEMAAIDPSVIQFKIGKNDRAVNGSRTEYDYVVLRHVPVTRSTFADWGLDLPDYLSKPTWTYASPHNVVARTPQTTVEGQSCTAACHGSPGGPQGFLLRESDLHVDGDPNQPRLPDYEANLHLVIEGDFPGK